MWSKRKEYPTERQGTVPTMGATGYKITLDRSAPIDHLMLRVAVTVTGTFASIKADGILGVVKNLKLLVPSNEDGQIRTIIDCSGIGLLEYWRNYANFGPSTIEAIRTLNGNAGAIAASTYIISYPIPLAHVGLADPLRMFTLFPANEFKADPYLLIDFCTNADIGTTGTCAIDWQLVETRCPLSSAVRGAIEKKGGFITYDMIERSVPNVPSSAVKQEVRYVWDPPGALTGVLFRGYTSVSARGDVSLQSGQDHFSAEPWVLESGLNILRRFRFNAQAEKQAWTFSSGWGIEDDNAKAEPRINGSYFFDFLSEHTNLECDDLGSAYDIQGDGNTILQARGNVLGGTGVALNVLSHRFTSNLAAFRHLRTQLAAA